MKVVVLGAGRVGFNIAKALSLSENDVSVVDSSSNSLNIVSEKLDVKPVFGHAADIDVLKEAGIKDADTLIAVTSSDEVNITACQIADFMFGTNTKIARINKSAYFTSGNIFEKGKFPIDFVISPTHEIAKIIKRNISIPGALDVITCMNNKVSVVGVVCKKGAPIVNIKLKYITSIDNDTHISILYVRKQSTLSILPGKADAILPGDEVFFACPSDEILHAMQLFGYGLDTTNNVTFVGGGNLCEKIVNSITTNDLSIKIIEKELLAAEELSEKLNHAEILHGDPLDPEVLEAANVAESGIVISITDDDKTNILSCLLSKKLGANRVAAVLNDSSYSKLLYSLGINSILDSRQASVSKILHYLQKGSIEDVITFDDDEIEVIAIEAVSSSYVVGVLTEDITSKNEVYIAAIVREDQIFMLPRRMIINAGDRALFVVRKNSVDRLLKLFSEKPKYLA